jgi:hypothetical protein
MDHSLEVPWSAPISSAALPLAGIRAMLARRGEAEFDAGTRTRNLEAGFLG